MLDAFLQLLALERIAQVHALEQFRREVGNTLEIQVFAGGEGVADLDGAVVVQADDVAGPGFFQMGALTGEEG